jgi:uroporphyrinogen-III synthase
VDPALAHAWPRGFIETPFDDPVLLTGEGLRAKQHIAPDLSAGFPHGLLPSDERSRAATSWPGRRGTRTGIRPAGSGADDRGLIKLLSQDHPTIEALACNRHFARPADFLQGAGAIQDPALPYAYASQAQDERVAALRARWPASRLI